jgi:hypothetical protein
MSRNRAVHLQLVPRDPALQAVNEKIAKLVAVKPWSDIYGSFSLSAYLADQAAAAVMELQQMPGANAKALESALKFWLGVRAENNAAALSLAGGNRNLVDALIAYHFLQNTAGEVPNA